VQENCITIELGLPDLIIESQHTEGEALVITVRFSRTECQCPARLYLLWAWCRGRPPCLPMKKAATERRPYR